MDIDHGDRVGEMPIPDCVVGMRILVVEHDIPSLTHTISLLQESTYQVTTVEQPEVALTMLRDQETKYDLIVVASNMKGISCLEFLSNVKSLSDVPVVVGCSEEDLKQGEIAKQQGASIILEKPFSRNDARSLWQYVFTRSNKRGNGHVRGDLKTPCLNIGTSSHATREQKTSQSQQLNDAVSNRNICDHSIADIVKEDKVESHCHQNSIGIVDKGKGKEVAMDVHKRKRIMDYVGDEGSAQTEIERSYKINNNENDSKKDDGKMDINFTSNNRLQCDTTGYNKFIRVLPENHQRHQVTPSRSVSSPRAQVSNILTHTANYQQSSYIDPHRRIMNPTATVAGHNTYYPQQRLQFGDYPAQRDYRNTAYLGTISGLQPRNVFKHKLPIAGLYGTGNVYRGLNWRPRSNRGIMNNLITGNQFNQTVPARGVCLMNRENVSTSGSINGNMTSQTVPFGRHCQMTRNTIGTNGSIISNMTKQTVPVGVQSIVGNLNLTRQTVPIRALYPINKVILPTNGPIMGDQTKQTVGDGGRNLINRGYIVTNMSIVGNLTSQSSAVLSTNMQNGVETNKNNVESVEQIPSLQGRIDEIRREYWTKKHSERKIGAASKQQSILGANSSSNKGVNQQANPRGTSTDHNPSETLGNHRGTGTSHNPIPSGTPGNPKGADTGLNNIPSGTPGYSRGTSTNHNNMPVRVLPPEPEIHDHQDNTGASSSQPLGEHGLFMEEIIAELNSDTEENDLQSLGFDIPDIL